MPVASGIGRLKNVYLIKEDTLSEQEPYQVWTKTWKNVMPNLVIPTHVTCYLLASILLRFFRWLWGVEEKRSRDLSGSLECGDHSPRVLHLDFQQLHRRRDDNLEGKCRCYIIAFRRSSFPDLFLFRSFNIFVRFFYPDLTRKFQIVKNASVI